jgi:hypothetical protein
MNFPSMTVELGVAAAIQMAIWVPFVYLSIRDIRSLSAAERWKLLKIALTILSLPFVLVWQFATAGNDCGCSCDEDD